MMPVHERIGALEASVSLLSEAMSRLPIAEPDVVQLARPAIKPADPTTQRATESAKPATMPAMPATKLVIEGATMQLPIPSVNFLLAQPEPVRTDDEALRLLKSMIGLARLLDRTLIVPSALCACDGAACEPSPFGCPLTPVASSALSQWRRYNSSSALLEPPPRSSMLPPLIAANRFHGAVARAALPGAVRRSHVRVSLPDGMSHLEAQHALRDYGDTRILEVERATAAFCGWDARHDPEHAGLRFEDEVNAALGRRTALHECTHFHAGAGVVLAFSNVGTAGDVTTVSAPFDALPESVRRLPNGTDLLVTFATGSVSTMALNWAAAVRKAGISELLIGALDAAMMAACERANVPCVLINGGETSKILAANPGQNLRSRPSLYPKMSVLKVGYYRELLSYGYNVWACDADALFISDPRPLMRLPEWRDALVAAATDCIDLRRDAQYPMMNCDLNTGLVYMRAHPTTLEFTARWRETIASAKEVRIRDQAAFNMLLKSRRLRHLRHRLFTAANGPSDITLGILPLSRFLNGHTFFVQHAHQLPSAELPLSVHLTYQFAEGATFAYGKRQRLREAGLWMVDDDDYYRGRYITASRASANLQPVQSLGEGVHSRDAIERHLAEARHRSRVLRALLGLARATGRTVILPRMLCYVDYMWKEMIHGRVGGGETMALPFECPMDHVLVRGRALPSALRRTQHHPAPITDSAPAPHDRRLIRTAFDSHSHRIRRAGLSPAACTSR